MIAIGTNPRETIGNCVKTISSALAAARRLKKITPDDGSLIVEYEHTLGGYRYEGKLIVDASQVTDPAPAAESVTVPDSFRRAMDGDDDSPTR